MENSTSQKLASQSKKVVELLNKAKYMSFGNKTELAKWLKDNKCPNHSFLVPYLSRNNELVPHGEFGFICFKDKKPYYFGDFIAVLDRFRIQKNHFNNTYNLKKRQEDKKINPCMQDNTSDSLQIPSVPQKDKVITINLGSCSRWNKFWVKFFFGISL